MYVVLVGDLGGCMDLKSSVISDNSPSCFFIGVGMRRLFNGVFRGVFYGGASKILIVRARFDITQHSL